MSTISTPVDLAPAKFEQHTRAIQERRRDIRKRNAPESEMDALFREQRDWDTKLLGSMKYSGVVGRDPVGFCRVCQRAISRIIDLYSK